MSAEAKACRLCGSGTAQDQGAIPDSDFFAGQALARPLAGGRLYRCDSCASMFRHPILTSSEYLALYREGVPQQWSVGATRDAYWSGAARREDFRIILAIITGEPAGSVLDIGCGSGEFLASLPDCIRKSGIEPSRAAALASLLGIKIVAPELESCPPEYQFDAVTLIDVIEHVPHPAHFLSLALSHVRVGGLLIVSTGNPEVSVWQSWFRARFWYVSFPEHVSFPAHQFFEQWCSRSGAVIAERHFIRYQVLTPLRRAIGVLIQIAYFLSPRVFSSLGRLAAAAGAVSNSHRHTYSPGIPGAFVDHHVVAIRKL